MKWSELKKQGVIRCNAWFVSGKQCRKRVDANATGAHSGYCKQHGPMIERLLEPHLKAIRLASKSGG